MNNILKKIPNKGDVFLNHETTVALSKNRLGTELVLWKLQNETIIRSLTGIFGTPFTFVPNEKKFMCVVFDKGLLSELFSSMKIYDWENDIWSVVCDLYQEVVSCRFSSDGKFLFISNKGGQIFVLDWSKKFVIYRFDHDSAIVDATFTPENNLLFTDVNGSIHVGNFNKTDY